MGHDKEETAKGHGRQDTAKGHGRQDTAKGHGRQDAAKTDDAEGDKDKRAAAVVRLDQIARNFETYEDFLDSQVTEMDMFYIEDRSIARTIKELGFHGNAEKITREQFNEKKSVIKKSEEFKLGAKYLYTDRDVFLLELARREDANLSGRLVTVVYIRDRNAKGQEISSYIDYALRLHEDDFASIFAGRQRLSSKITDLSHFNWDTNVTHSNNSPNFDVIFHGQGGIRLKCKKDRRVIHLDPNRQITDTNIEDSTRTLVRSGNYAQVVLFDHFIRFWANKEDSAQSEEKLPLGPDSKDGSSTSTDRGLDLYDNVTAAIYEDDLLEIARNALGGTLHQEHQGEWVPADILMDDELERGRLGGRGPDDPSAPANSLETSVLGTMKGLYDAHKNDISFGTLGNFTFIQMIEQLTRLLPEKARRSVDQEAAKIAAGTANITVKISEEDLPPVTVDADELVETYEKIPAASVAPAALRQDPAAVIQAVGPPLPTTPSPPDDPLADLISIPQRHKGLEEPPAELLSGTTAANVTDFFDPVPQMDAIRKLYPESQRSPTFAAAAATRERGKAHSSDLLVVKDKGRSIIRLPVGAVVGKKTLQMDNVSGSRDQSEYFKQLEARMEAIFHGTVKEDGRQLPAYPNPISLPANGSKKRRNVDR